MSPLAAGGHPFDALLERPVHGRESFGGTPVEAPGQQGYEDATELLALDEPGPPGHRVQLEDVVAVEDAGHAEVTGPLERLGGPARTTFGFSVAPRPPGGWSRTRRRVPSMGSPEIETMNGFQDS